MSLKKLLIVGGGRTGWMAAAYLDAALRNNGQCSLEIRVLERAEAPRHRAAEAAIPELKHMLAVIGIDEIDFLQRTRGTFRQATRYVNWLRGTGDFFYHAFDDARAQPIDRAALQWLMSDRSIAFAETVSPQPILCDLGLAPRPVEGPSPESRLKYTYHADEVAFTSMLRDIAMERGVQRYVGELADVDLGEGGQIEAVHTSGGARLDADLFIDCSGSDALLIGKQLEVDWVDCSAWLPCDRRVSMDVHYEQFYPGRVQPFTTATAVSAGWVQEIPLQDRRSMTYVYSSRHIDDADARRELRAFEGKRAQELETHATSFAVGHRAKVWAGNCVSLGASGGSMEPLESAGHYLADIGTMVLAEYFPFEGDTDACAFRYNRIMANRFYEILDFANMQYSLTKRVDTAFWREVAQPEHVNERVRARLDYWKLKAPSMSDFVDQRFPGQQETALPTAGLPGDHRSPVDTAAVFGLERHEAMLYGMQFLADECDEWFGTARPPTQVPRYIIGDLQRAPATLPPHDQFLQRAAGMASYATAEGQRR